MNTLFETLLKESTLTEKDTHDIRQIFCLLSPKKQQRLIKNFSVLCTQIEKINADIELEQKILFEDLITDLDELLKGTKKFALKRDTNTKIQNLKGGL